MADCRKCIFFISFEQLSDDVKEKTVVQAAKRGKEPLGWCTRAGHVITYYRGRCRFYTPRSSIIKPAKKPITEYLKVISGD